MHCILLLNRYIALIYCFTDVYNRRGGLAPTPRAESSKAPRMSGAPFDQVRTRNLGWKWNPSTVGRIPVIAIAVDE